MSSYLLSLQQMPAFAKDFIQHLKAGDVISLVGPIGVGKTTWVRFLVNALQVQKDQMVSSPSFTVLNQYHCEECLVNHVDLYRLDHYADFEQLDIISTFTQPDAITFVEWGDKFSEMQSLYTQTLISEYVKESEDLRKLTHVTKNG